MLFRRLLRCLRPPRPSPGVELAAAETDPAEDRARESLHRRLLAELQALEAAAAAQRLDWIPAGLREPLAEDLDGGPAPFGESCAA